MDELLNFLTSKEIVFVYILAGLACLICLIVYLIERNNENLRKKHNTRELNKLVEEIVEELDAEEARINYTTPVIQSVELIEDTSKKEEQTQISIAPIEVKEDNSLESEVQIEQLEDDEEIQYTSIEPDQETAKIELQKLEAELLRQEQIKIEEERQRQIEAEQARIAEAQRLELLRRDEQERLRVEAEKAKKLQEEQMMMEQEANQNIKLTAFEEEQEKTAIISLEELLQKSKEMYASNEVTQYKDEGNEPISLQDLERMVNKQSNDEPVIIANVIEDNSTEVKVEVIDQKVIEKIKLDEQKVTTQNIPVQQTTVTTKFKSSPIISPIYGIEAENSLELENTANYEKLDEQIKKSNNFVVSLKELQEKLD